MIEDLELGVAISAAMPVCAGGYPIVVGVSHGVVTLEGHVDTPDRRRAVEVAARKVAGVREVVNEITIRAIAAEEGESSADRPASE